MAVYLVAAVEPKNDHYAHYATLGAAALIGRNVERLAVDDDPRLLEGTLPAPRVILMRFESQSELDDWWQSPEYQAARPFRHAGARTEFIIAVEG